jgi:hypothetical protein
MGYQATSAEKVYRYALRLDNSDRSLTDRFGLSIIFVNDTSPVCQEFLIKYCVDLCFRTADRIRFIFFSELPEREFERVANDMNRSFRDPSKGMLKTLLRLIGIGRNYYEYRFDYEYETWRDLRPASLQPLRNLEEINEGLDRECDSKTAMPGAGMAMQFAQRLGIGRHVPCFVIFTDIGKLHLDLMPVENMSPEDMYSHLRNWIDSYYEINRDKIEGWQEIEDEIESICHRVNSSLRQIQGWREKTLTAWQNLRAISEIIRVVKSEDRDEWKKIFTEYINKYDFPTKIQELFRDFLAELEQLEKLNTTVLILAQAKERVQNAEGFDAMFTTVRSLDQEIFTQLRVARPSTLQNAIDELWQRSQLLKDPRAELKVWWSRYAGKRLPLKRFNKLRNKWIYLTGDAGRVIKEEHELISDAVWQLPISIDPEQGAKIVVDVLAGHYSIDADSQEWQNAISVYQNHIRDHLLHICSATPEWLLKYIPQLSIRDAVFSTQDTTLEDVNEFIKSNPEIQRAVEKAELSHNSVTPDIQRQNDEIAKGWQKRIIDDLQVLIEECVVRQDAWISAGASFLTPLRQWRRKLEVEVYNENYRMKKAQNPGKPIDFSLISQLNKALDEYDKVVETIQYPHLDDPMVQRVPLSRPVATAAKIIDLRENVPATQRLRNSMAEAVNVEKESTQLWSRLQNEVLNWTPVTAFANALLKVVGEDSLEVLLNKYPGANIQERLEHVLNDHLTDVLLEALDDEKLGKLAEIIRDDKAKVREYSKRDELMGLILSGLGIYNGGRPFSLNPSSGKQSFSEILQRKIAGDEFDVFMAHSSKDKPAVLNIGESLMKKDIYPWIDVEQIPPGQWFQDVIQNVIPKVKSVAIFFGSTGIGRWQALEIRAFVSQCVERNIPVIPVLLPGVNEVPRELIFLRELNWVRFHDQINENKTLNQLAWGITGERSFS